MITDQKIIQRATDLYYMGISIEAIADHLMTEFRLTTTQALSAARNAGFGH